MNSDTMLVYILMWCSRDKLWGRVLNRVSLLDKPDPNVKVKTFLMDGATTNLRKAKQWKRRMAAAYPTRYYVIRTIQVSKL